MMFPVENNTENLARGSRLEATMFFKVENISNFKGDSFSEPTLIGNVPWRTRVKFLKPTLANGQGLQICLLCDGDGENPHWSTCGTVTQKILSHAPGLNHWEIHTHQIFNSSDLGASYWGLSADILWSDLINPSKGFVENGAVIIQTDVKLNLAPTLSYGLGRSEATLRFHPQFNYIFDLEENFSAPTYMKNLPWRIEAALYPKESIEKKTLGIYLKCLGDPESPEWSCKVNAKIIIMRLQQPGAIPLVSNGWSHTFSHAENQFGFSDFITFKQVFDPTEGFIKDGFLQIEIDFKDADAIVGPENPVLNNGPEEQSNQSGIIVPRIHLECPICKELPRGEVFQCRNGHFLCADCNNKLHFCPQCRQRLEGERLRSIETILDDVEMDCAFKEQGCNFKTLRKVLTLHENSCGFRSD